MTVHHTLQSGECLTTLAYRYGLRDHLAIYDHPENAELKRTRPSPNVMNPGDVVAIPDRKPKKETLAVDRQHRLRVHRPRKELRVVLEDGAGDPIASTAYTLQVDGRAQVEGTTDGDGALREPVPAGARGATLTLSGRPPMRLWFGTLPPMSDVPDEGVRGAQSRLRNLGYHVAATDGRLDASTCAAIALFQHDHGLDVDGELSSALADQLYQEHGS